MSKLFKGLTILAMLVSSAAFAHDRRDRDDDRDCDRDYHPASPVTVVAPPPAPVGHYEVRQVRTFIPGHFTFIRRGHHLVRVFNPGHYEFVAQRVWVNGPVYDGPQYSYGVQVAPPPPVQNQGGISFGLAFNG